MGQTDLQNLLDMGFESARAEIALKKSGNLMGAIEWLEKNQDKSLEEIQAEIKEDEAGEAATSVAVLEEGEAAKSLVCNECGKKFRNMVEANFHATKSEHTDFSESTEEIALLTAEEKKQKLEELREKLKAKKAAQSTLDKEEAKKNEKIRMKSTRETQDAKEELARKKAIEEAAKKRKEQAEDKEYMKQLRAKIAADKEERKRKFEEEKARREGKLPDYKGSPSQTPAQVLAASAPKGNAGDVRLKLMVGAKPVMKRYTPETTLFEVAEDLKKDGTVMGVSQFEFKLANKKFDSIDFGQTLQEAGLAPSAILTVVS